MNELYRSAAQLYDLAFPGEDPSFRAAFFGAYCPTHLRTICDRGRVVSMLVSVPYPIVTADGIRDARYLYAVATHPDFRGRGLAKQLLRAEAAGGVPVFLRPMREELFSFYRDAGLTPFSPFVTLSGRAAGGMDGISVLSARGYRAARRAFLPLPFAEPEEKFLSLTFLSGGALHAPGRFAALFEREGKRVIFKEWLGDRSDIPRAAAFLGADSFVARCYDAAGTPFGTGVGLPENTLFLPALD